MCSASEGALCFVLQSDVTVEYKRGLQSACDGGQISRQSPPGQIKARWKMSLAIEQRASFLSECLAPSLPAGEEAARSNLSAWPGR